MIPGIKAMILSHEITTVRRTTQNSVLRKAVKRKLQSRTLYQSHRFRQNQSQRLDQSEALIKSLNLFGLVSLVRSVCNFFRATSGLLATGLITYFTWIFCEIAAMPMTTQSVEFLVEIPPLPLFGSLPRGGYFDQF